MPGLCLHADEAARLLDLRPAGCRVVLEHLVEAGQLRRDDKGRYLRG